VPKPGRPKASEILRCSHCGAGPQYLSTDIAGDIHCARCGGVTYVTARIKAGKAKPRKPRVIKPISPTGIPIKEAEYIVCPACWMARKLFKTRKGKVRFGGFAPESSYLIQVRNVAGGRASGFPVLRGYTIDEVKGMPEHKELLGELKTACRRILEKLE